MKKLTLAAIVFAGMSSFAFAQKDTTVKKPIIKDTIKPKETGLIYSTENMLAFGIATDSIKKSSPKPDTLKTGAIDVKGSMYSWVSPQTDSAKAKVKSDTIKSETKMNTTGSLSVSSSMIAYFNGPLTDSTKKATSKPDSTIGKPTPQKRSTSLYFDKKTGSIIALPKELNYSEVV